MPNQSKKDQSKGSRFDWASPKLRKLLEERGREVPHPGTVKVTIFTNPRVNKTKDE